MISQFFMIELRKSAKYVRTAPPTKGPMSVPTPPSQVMIRNWPDRVQWNNSGET